MWLSIELLAHARFYIRIRTTRGSLPHVVIIISAYCITIFLSSACAYKPGFTVYMYYSLACDNVRTILYLIIIIHVHCTIR